MAKENTSLPKGDNLLSRVKDITKEGELAAITMFLYSIPRETALLSDGLVAYSGMGEDIRITDALAIWESGAGSARHLLLPGHNKEEKTWTPMSKATLSHPPFNVGEFTNIIMQEHSANTKTQAEWIVRKTKDYNIKSLALFDTPFHLLRAYLTLLQEFKSHNMRIPIFPVYSNVSPDTNVPEAGASAFSLAQGELDRIREYQKKGDVADYKTTVEYLTWLWKQPMLKDVRAGNI